MEAFKKPDEWIGTQFSLPFSNYFADFRHSLGTLGKEMRILTDLYTPREFVKICQEESGKTVKLIDTSREAFEQTQHVKELHEIWSK